MNLTRWNDPFAGLSSMHSQLDDLFNSFFSGTQPSQSAPTLDVYTEDDKTLVAELQAPGFTKDDIEVNVHNGVLEVKGEKHQKEENKNKKRSYVVRESHASFYRSIALPKGVDAGNVQATFEDGLLKITIPLKELPAPRRVAITAGSSARTATTDKKATKK